MIFFVCLRNFFYFKLIENNILIVNYLNNFNFNTISSHLKTYETRLYFLNTCKENSSRLKKQNLIKIKTNYYLNTIEAKGFKKYL